MRSIKSHVEVAICSRSWKGCHRSPRICIMWRILLNPSRGVEYRSIVAFASLVGRAYRSPDHCRTKRVYMSSIMLTCPLSKDDGKGVVWTPHTPLGSDNTHMMFSEDSINLWPAQNSFPKKDQFFSNHSVDRRHICTGSPTLGGTSPSAQLEKVLITS